MDDTSSKQTLSHDGDTWSQEFGDQGTFSVPPDLIIEWDEFSVPQSQDLMQYMEDDSDFENVKDIAITKVPTPRACSDGQRFLGNVDPKPCPSRYGINPQPQLITIADPWSLKQANCDTWSQEFGDQGTLSVPTDPIIEWDEFSVPQSQDLMQYMEDDSEFENVGDMAVVNVPTPRACSDGQQIGGHVKTQPGPSRVDVIKRKPGPSRIDVTEPQPGPSHINIIKPQPGPSCIDVTKPQPGPSHLDVTDPQPGPSHLDVTDPQHVQSRIGVIDPKPGPSGLRKRCITIVDPRRLKQAKLGITSKNDATRWNLAGWAEEPRIENEGDEMAYFYELRPVTSTFIKKFNVYREDNQAQFKNMESIAPEDFPIQVHKILDEILRKLIGTTREGKIRVAMDADGLAHPYNSPFVNVEDFDHMRVIDNIAKILNSNESLVLAGNEIRINIIKVNMPAKGAGKQERHLNNRRIIDPVQWVKQKHSMITIKNNDNLCLARALVVAIVHANKLANPNDTEIHKQYKNICDARCQLQKIEAERLHREAGVLLGSCGIPEILLFQQHLTNYRILVYSAEMRNKLIFSGPRKPGSQRLCVFLNDGHYDVITSLTGFHGSSYICEECLAPTRDLKQHGCKTNCYACKSFECKPMEIAPTILCAACNRYFYNQECQDMHITNGTCASKFRCTFCYRLGHHVQCAQCYETKCNICKQRVEYGHLCYMQKEKINDFTTAGAAAAVHGDQRKALKQPPAYFFYDFECMQETDTHIPNLVICKDESDVHKVFYGANCRNDFCEWIFKDNCGLPKSDREVVFIAHYAKAYDSFLILEYLHQFKKFITPIKTGLKILSLKISDFNVTFLDSHSFIPIPLSKFPTTFGLTELKKGYFPHFFNTSIIQDYEGPLPDPEYYGANTMSVGNYKVFTEWYGKEQQKYTADPNKRFNLKTELISYCASDVQILKEACMIFRHEFLQTTQVDPFCSVTIASACHKVFRTHILQPNTIAIIPQDGYGGRKSQQSVKALKWMSWLEQQGAIEIRNAKSVNGEAKVGGKFIDGICTAQKTMYEFHGCYYHGCPKCFLPRETNKRKGRNMGDLYALTLDRETFLRNIKPDFTLHTIWECDYDHQIKTNDAMATYINNLTFDEALKPRDAFYGGRTHASCLYKLADEYQAIRYYDYVSLYPTVNKFGKMPVGHPVTKYPATYAKEEYFGLIKATILPPKGLYHPVLPYRARGKLLFPLCRTCAEDNLQDKCSHDDRHRELHGTWCTPEVDVALDEGYRIIRVQEVWHYSETAEYGKSESHPTGLFGAYVNMFLKIKQQASGWPSWVQTDADKDEFITDYFTKEKVMLEKDKVAHNPGQRALAKLCLNSFWGRFGMREDLPLTEYVQDYDRFIELLSSGQYTVTDANAVNEDMLLVSYKTDKDCIQGSQFTNVVIASFTTSLARLKLYELLKILGKDALYMDTDSVIFISPKDSDPLQHYLGESLGKVTDEIFAEYGPGNFIQEFVSGGPKNYGYRVSNGATKFKVKGITQTFENKDKVNFKVMLDLVVGLVGDGEKTKIILNEKKIKRDMLKAKLTNVNTKRSYQIVYDKAVVGANYVAYPFGF